MTPEKILSQPARYLTQVQRETYLEDGCLFIERFVDESWLERLRAATSEHLDASRALRESNRYYDLAPGHCAEQPRIRRLQDPDQYSLYWEFATGPLADVAVDLLGADIAFNHSKINFKWPGAGATNEVAWHQDAHFYPLTNYKSVAIGVYLEDTTPDHGPLMVVKGSHNGEIFDHYDENGVWVGRINAEEEAEIDPATVVEMPGPAGSITIHNIRSLHASRPSRAANMRPFLVNAYTAADAFPYGVNYEYTSPHYCEIVRGTAARQSWHDPRPCPIPPDWSAGYPSLFDQHHGKEVAAGGGM